MDLKSRMTPWLAQAWLWISEPRLTTNETERYRIRLLFLLLAGSNVGLLLLLCMVAFSAYFRQERGFLLSFFSCVFMMGLGLNALARNGHYTAAVLISSLFYSAVISICVIYFQRVELAAFLVLGILFAGLFLIPRLTVYISLFNILLQGVFYGYLPAGMRNLPLFLAYTLISIMAGLLMTFSMIIQRSNEDQIHSQTDKLAENTAQLQTWAAELEMRTYMMEILTQMSQELHSARNQETVQNTVAKYADQLFPGTFGAIYTVKRAGKELAAQTAWGSTENQSSQFLAVDCFAIQMGRPYQHACRACNPLTVHAQDENSAPFTCIPLLDDEERLGVLHLRGLADSGSRLIADTAADYIALALANLHLRETLREQATHDSLTNLYNRRSFEIRMNQELARSQRSGKSFSLVMIDIDHFKRFNDSYGHDAGDEVLRFLAKFLQAHFRSSDVVCRYGGEEFAIILPDSELDGAVKHIELVRQEIAKEKVEFNDSELHPIHISAGVASFPEHGQNLVQLFRTADAALYAAKSGGRNRVAVAGNQPEANPLN